MISDLIVFVHLPQTTDAVPAGTLRMTEDRATVLDSRFQYGNRYLERQQRLAMDPLTLALPPGENLQGKSLRPVNGLAEFGVFRDAAPDLWGRRVIENRLQRTGPLPESVYLRHAGSNRVGALDFRDRPDSTPQASAIARPHDLGYLLEASERIEAGEPVPASLSLIFDTPSLGGARPKAVIRDQGVEWLAKFPARDDRFSVPWIEYATLRMAHEAGLNVPPVRMETIGNKPVLLIRRFDREMHADRLCRRHFMSALSMLGRHESESPQAGYADIAKAIIDSGSVGVRKSDLQELFGRMVFNILVHNNDDHLRNHGFLWSPLDQAWRLSPLYDVVPSPVIGSERFLHLRVGMEGRLATLTNAMSQHGLYGLTPAQALGCIQQIANVVREWKTWFESVGVAGRDIDAVASAFQHPRALGLEKLLRKTAEASPGLDGPS